MCIDEAVELDNDDCIECNTDDSACSPLIRLSSSSGFGSGFASGGTDPGSVVIALKWATIARIAITMKNVRWKTPAKVSCVGADRCGKSQHERKMVRNCVKHLRALLMGIN